MKTIYVYENWLSEKPSLLGKLYVDTIRGGESYAFEYDEAWLSNPAAVMLDPDLNLYTGRQYLAEKHCSAPGGQVQNTQTTYHF